MTARKPPVQRCGGIGARLRRKAHKTSQKLQHGLKDRKIAPMSAREILRRPGFAPLATTYGLSELGDWLTTIALSVLVYDATGSALATTVLFVCSKFLPAFVAPAVTARIDGVAPRRSLPVLYAIEAAGFAGMAVLHGVVPAIVVLAAVCGGAALVARALTRAAVAATLGGEDDDGALLRRGNGVLNVVFSVAFAVGPAVAGGTVATLGAPATLLAGTAVFVVMALVARIAVLPALVVDADEDGVGWWEKLARGVRHLRREPLTARMFGGQAALLVLFTMIPPIEVVYARHELGTTAAGLGALMAAWGAGAVAGSAIFARVSRGATLGLALTATAAIGASYLGMGIAGSLTMACALSALGGVGNGMQWIAFVTAVQERVPGELQARAMALVEALGSAVPGLGFALGGALATAVSARFAYVLAGASILTIASVAALALRGLPTARPRTAVSPA